MYDDIKSEMVALVPRLRRFGYSLSGSRDEGEDLVQTACLKALGKLDQFQPGTRLDSWMFRIVQTTWIDRVRSRSRRAEVSDPDDFARVSDDGKGARVAEGRMTLAKVRERMKALPEDQRAVLALVAIEGYSYKAAAEALEIPVGTVMSRLARARSKLLPLLKENN
ncbi:RNA polymerase sigma factor [Pelagibius litoralis]|uniref:RNA polymerase sigma factor n=1 Tax=Pelagibius litoralis TaxID=374515 RepID=A0A967F391_9PROT|nr:RNA polymerase sigma factor [Pelagibius litoralis]NIA72416.1 RNA polymerase sigma factor [Pelagibius litoralis]